MNITVTINRYEKDNLRGFANIKFDENYALENVKIKAAQNSDKLYVELPRYKRTDRNGESEYKDVFHPISTEMRQAFNEAVLTAYNQSDDNQRVFAFSYGDKPLTIKNVGVNLYEKDNMRGFANVVFANGFALENVRVKYSDQSKSLYPDLAKYRTADKDEQGNIKVDENGETLYTYKDIFHPITKDDYNNLRTAVITAYEAKKAAHTLKQLDASEAITDKRSSNNDDSDNAAVAIGSIDDFKEIFSGVSDDNLGDVMDLTQASPSRKK